MPPILTEEQALALITDYGSQARGKKLAVPKTWTNLGADEMSVWGECQGSGKTPYLVAAALTEVASKCSCPSPDKPCKHAAGLLLLYVKQPELFTAPSSDKLTAWQTARRQHASREARQGQPRDPAEVAAAVARLEAGVDAKRQQRMLAGAAELAAVLEDAVQQGLAASRPAEHWDGPAQRLVDNQLPGLAAALRELPALVARPERLLARLGELYTLARATQNLPQLPPAARQEVLQQVGVTFKREDLLDAYEPVADEWLVLGAVEGGDKDKYGNRRSPTRRTWLRGVATGRFAMLYEYAHGQEDLPGLLPPGSRQAGSLVFYPGLLPLRATPVQPLTALDAAGAAGAASPSAANVPAGVSIVQLLAGYAAAIGRAPWLRQYPAVLVGVRPARLGKGRRALHHPAENLTIELLPQPGKRAYYEDNFDERWRELLGATLEHPCTVSGEWDGHYFRLLRVWPLDQPSPTGLPGRAATAPTGNGYGSPWPALLQVATVGTHRAAVPELPGLPATAPAPQRLLLAAGTAALLQKAGYESPAGVQPLLPPADPEPWPVLGPAGSALLAQADQAILTDYLRRLRENQWRVPPRQIVALLRHNTSPELHYPHTQVLGRAGEWLLHQDSEWKYHRKPDEPKPKVETKEREWFSWSEWRPGDLPLPKRKMQDMGEWVDKDVLDVRNYLRYLHHTDPEAARPLFREALAFADKLTSHRAYNQLHILNAFDQNLSPEEAAITETYLLQPNEYQKEYYDIIREPLLRMPDSPLQARVWARAEPLLAVQRRAGKATLKVTLPTEWDESWQADGVEAPPSYGRPLKAEGGKYGTLLWQLLAMLPLSRWTTHLGLSSTELLALAAAHVHGPSLLKAWSKSTARDPDPEATRQLIVYQLQGRFVPASGHETDNTLLRRLSRDEQLTLVRQHLAAHTCPPYLLVQALTTIANNSGYPAWPADLAVALLDTLRVGILPTVTADHYDQPRQWLPGLAQLFCHTPVLHEELLPRYADELPRLLADFPLATPELSQMLASVNLRLAILAALANPAA